MTGQTREAKLRHLLETTFSPTHLVIHNTSEGHRGHRHASGESHFDVKIVSEQFSGMSRIARHRAINAAAQPLFDEGLHALAIRAQSPEE